MKTVKERDDLDLLELVCQLHSRANRVMNKEMHDAYVEARQELELRIVAYQNLVKPDVIKSVCICGSEEPYKPSENAKGYEYCPKCFISRLMNQQ